ncbi:MAG: prepilin-type N-terminal cleavage/methylation domain-containing protein [Patescibacteria group bacterium]|nr:prepilin-type N-terminal cleavage/methylation domain-containing protein [Patescibacteria group bacterium]
MKNKRGFTLIESLVLLFIFSITVLTFYKTYMLVTHYSLETKYRTAAVELATAEMEILRNTPYEDIILDSATSPPTGSAVSSESGTGLDYDRAETVNGSMYRILTEIYYVDDAQDGEGMSNDDAINDYKRVNITVLWGDGMSDSSNTSKSISLTSFFVPPSGSESAIENGILSVNVVDSNGDAVSGATVEVDDVNGAPAPDVDEDDTTDTNGNVLFEDIPTGMDMYQIAVSKSGSEYIETSATPTYPTYAHASVLPGTITTLTIVQDINPDFSIITKDPFGNILTDIVFIFTGGHVLGLDSSSEPVYINTDITTTSDSTSGEVILWDTTRTPPSGDVSGYTASIGKYDFTLDDEDAYTLWKFNPITSAEYNAVEVTANLKNLDEPTAHNYNGDGVDDNEMIIIDDLVNGVIVSVTDSITTGAFECATVQLERTESPTYDQTQQTDIFGMVYFPVDEDDDGTLDTDEELDDSKEYDIIVNAPTCNDTCTSNCDNDCVENDCVEGCVIYEDDCTDYYEYTSGSFYKYYAEKTDTVTPDGLQSKAIELSPDET